MKFVCNDRYCTCNGCAAQPDAAFGANLMRYPRSVVARFSDTSVSKAVALEPGGATTISTLIFCAGDPSENCRVMVPRLRLPAVSLLKSGYTRNVVGWLGWMVALVGRKLKPAPMIPDR